ncbi:MAG: hypothetical protein JW840_02980 [Candidatus Thermoplasmatota archaeon]|nr:hypothetical protein [Candidatus Thermoplasmatota archaeon]
MNQDNNESTSEEDQANEEENTRPIEKKNFWDIEENNENKHVQRIYLSDYLQKVPLLTLQQTLNVRVPPGVFFFPCCGRDTLEPLLLFVDCINDFHFVDIEGAVLPPMECNPCIRQDGAGRDHQDFLAIPRQLIKGVRQVEHYHNVDNQIFPPCEYRYNCPSHVDFKQYHLTINSNPRLWEKFSQTKRLPLDIPDTQIHHIDIVVTCHTTCAELLLQKFGRISVFFCRGDSASEGGSDIHWFAPPLFDLLLFKLTNGGFIVHDDSDILSSFLIDQQYCREPRTNQVFCHNRYFVYHGKISNCYVWQVFHQPHPLLHLPIIEIPSETTNQDSPFLAMLNR